MHEQPLVSLCIIFSVHPFAIAHASTSGVRFDRVYTSSLLRLSFQIHATA